MKGTTLILAAVLLSGCAEKKDFQPSGKPVVFVSIPPLAGLLAEIAGNCIDVRSLVGEGQSPHSYEPTARQLAALGEADALFTIGVPFERALLKKIKPLYPDLPIIGTDLAIQKRPVPHAHHGGHCTHGEGETDPHVWLAPLNCSLASDALVRGLMQLSPEHKNEYSGNHASLVEKLKALDREFDGMLEPHKGSRFYVFHPSFGYFADAYGLQQMPIELEGKSPSPRQLAELIGLARADGVKVVFVQKQFPVDSANAVANAIGGTVVQLDPLAEDVVANLRQIAESIVQALEQ